MHPQVRDLHPQDRPDHDPGHWHLQFGQSGRTQHWPPYATTPGADGVGDHSGHRRKCGDPCRGEEACPFEGAAVPPQAHVPFAGSGCPGELPQPSGGPHRDQAPEARARHPEGEVRQGPALPGDSAADHRPLREGPGLRGGA